MKRSTNENIIRKKLEIRMERHSKNHSQTPITLILSWLTMELQENIKLNMICDENQRWAQIRCGKMLQACYLNIFSLVSKKVFCPAVPVSLYSSINTQINSHNSQKIKHCIFYQLARNFAVNLVQAEEVRRAGQRVIQILMRFLSFSKNTR